METEIIQRFLESVGAKADIDLYLRLHRAQRKESFAMLAPNAQIVKSALDPLHFDLRILAGLGLLPVVVLGLLEPKDADAQATRVPSGCSKTPSPARSCARPRPPGGRQTVAAIRAIVARGAIPLVSLEATKDLTHRGALRHARVAGGRAGDAQGACSSAGGPGLVPNGGPIPPVVSLATDTQRLLAPGALPRGQAMLLRQVKLLVESVPQRLSVTVVNPLQLLRELFTVNGAGTLIRRGSRIDVHDAGTGSIAPRIEALFASAFEPPVRADFFAQPLARIFVEENYSGVAVVQDSPVAPYLTKFAVERQAQGEGIGGELWSMLARDFPRFFWRSRPANQINAWYAKQCDGFARFARVARLLARHRARDDRARDPLRAGPAQRLRFLSARDHFAFALHSAAIAAAATHGIAGGDADARDVAVGAGPLARLAVLHVGRRSGWIRADDAEIGARAVVLVRDARRDDDDVAGHQRDGGAAAAAEARRHAPLVDAQHLVRGAVVVVHRVEPVPPGG